MPDSQQATSNDAWFDALPRDRPPPTASGPQQPGQISVNVGSSPRPAAPAMIEKPSGGEPDTSWFDKLPRDPPPETKWPQQPAQASTAPTTPDLPAWAGGGGQRARVPAPAAPQQPQQPSWQNKLEAIPSGLYSGVSSLANVPTGIANLASSGIKAATGYDLGQLKPPIETNPTGYQPVGSGAQAIHDMSSAVGSTAALGGAAGMVSPFLRAGSVPSMVADSMAPTARTLAASAAGGAAEEPVAKNVPAPYQPMARLGANILAGGAVAGIPAAGENAVRSSIDPETARLAQLGRDTYGIPITAAQMSNDRSVKVLDSALKVIPFSGHGDLDHETQLAVNSAVARTFGEDAPKITPAVMQQARTRIGGVLQDVETRNPVNFDHQTMQDLSRIEADAHASLTPDEFSVVRKQLDGVMSNLQPNDQIAGNTYGNLMHKGSPLDAAENSKNPNISSYASDIKDALRQSLQRSLSSDDADAYREARTQWKNMKTIEPLTQSADVTGGASPSTGDINPTLLRAAVNRSYKDVPYRTVGDIPLNDIADIGQRFLKEYKSSGSAERAWWLRMLEHAGTGAAATVLGVEHGLPSMLELGVGAGGLAATGGVARLTSKALQSSAVANRMIRQGMTPPPPTTGQAVSGVLPPVATGAAARELGHEPQGPTINPATGLPQFNLADNQAAAANPDILGQIASQMASGSLHEPTALKSYVDQNKQTIRKQFGGQGIQNVMLVGALTRRPGTAFSVISEAPSPAIKQAFAQAGATDKQGLLRLAMSQPLLARALSQSVSGSVLSKPLESSIISALQSKGSEGKSGADVRTGDRMGAPRGGVASTRSGVQRGALGQMANPGKTPMVAAQI